MNHAQPRLPYRWLISVFIVLTASGMAPANYMELLRRVPDSANTLIMIDVERLLMSPIAMKEKWRESANSSQGSAPFSGQCTTLHARVEGRLRLEF